MVPYIYTFFTQPAVDEKNFVFFLGQNGAIYIFTQPPQAKKFGVFRGQNGVISDFEKITQYLHDSSLWLTKNCKDKN